MNPAPGSERRSRIGEASRILGWTAVGALVSILLFFSRAVSLERSGSFLGSVLGKLLPWVIYGTPVVALLALALGLAGFIRAGVSRAARTGVLLGGLVLIGVFIVFPALPSLAPPPKRRDSCTNNLKQSGIICMMFAKESRNHIYPELSPKAGRLMMANEGADYPGPLYPEYITDPAIFFCPSSAARTIIDKLRDSGEAPDPKVFLDDYSYFYVGYVITTDDEMEAFAKKYMQRVSEKLEFDRDLPAPKGRGSGGSDTFYRLRDGVEQSLPQHDGEPRIASEMRSKIPILIERLGNHAKPGGNVLYMDGNVEFRKYPDEWPMTPATMGTLELLDHFVPEAQDQKREAPEQK